MLIVTISRTSRHFSLVDARSQLHMVGAFITFSDCLVFSSPEPKAPGELIV